MEQDQFTAKVAQRAGVSLESAEALSAAILQTLAERISGGEAADLAAQLPAELKPHLTSAEEPAQAFGIDEFLRRVAERAGTDADRARAGVRAMFSTLREAVALGEVDDITAQLPKEFQELAGSYDGNR